MSKKIVAVCGDPGGAAAIAPVLKLLESKCNLTTFAYNAGEKILDSSRVNFAKIPETANESWIKEQIDGVDIIFTATSVNEKEWEKKFIKIANDQRIPTLAILDFWSSYGVRFDDGDGNLAYLPRKIAVMDSSAAQEVEKLGFSRESVVVTGQPALGELAKKKQNFSNRRSQYKISDQDLMVIFPSQPLESFCGDFYGFTEKTVLPELINSLENAQRDTDQKVHLVILPHPRENQEDYKHYTSSSVKIHLSESGGGHDYVLSADLVVGMNTMLLFESCYLGKPTVSLQPGLTQADSLPCNKWGASLAIYKKEEIASQLIPLVVNKIERQQLKERAISKCPPLVEDAAEKVVSLIENMWS